MSGNSESMIEKVATAIRAEVLAWRLQTDGKGRYRAVKDGKWSRELMGALTQEEAENAFEVLMDVECARAAIEAMREPTPEMMIAAFEADDSGDAMSLIRNEWQAMISAALSEDSAPAGPDD